MFLCTLTWWKVHGHNCLAFSFIESLWCSRQGYWQVDTWQGQEQEWIRWTWHGHVKPPTPWLLPDCWDHIDYSHVHSGLLFMKGQMDLSYWNSGISSTRLPRVSSGVMSPSSLHRNSLHWNCIELIKALYWRLSPQVSLFLCPHCSFLGSTFQ